MPTRSAASPRSTTCCASARPRRPSCCAPRSRPRPIRRCGRRWSSASRRWISPPTTPPSTSPRSTCWPARSIRRRAGCSARSRPTRAPRPRSGRPPRQAIVAVERNRRMVELVANLYQGISLGSILLLAAIGLAITFGVMGVINMAHGEMIMLGAYSAFVVQELFRAFLPYSWFDLYLVAAVPVAFLVAGADRHRARALGDPVSLWAPARDPARDLGREPDPAAGGAHDLRRAEPRGRQPLLDVGRDRGRGRPVPDLQPADHHRLLPGGARPWSR